MNSSKLIFFLLLIAGFSCFSQKRLLAITEGGRSFEYQENRTVKVKLKSGVKVTGKLKFEGDSLLKVRNKVFSVADIDMIKRESVAGNIVFGIGTGISAFGVGILALGSREDEGLGQAILVIVGATIFVIGTPLIVGGGVFGVFRKKYYSKDSEFSIIKEKSLSIIRTSSRGTETLVLH